MRASDFRRSRRRLLTAMAAAFFHWPAGAAAAASEDEAAAFVEDLSGRILAVFESRADEGERLAAFRSIFFEAADIRRLGFFMLGRYARKLERSRRDVYISLLQEYISLIFVRRFGEYEFSGRERLDVVETRRKSGSGTEFIVSSRLDWGDGRQALPIRWWLFIDEKGRMRVFDLQIERIWLAQEQRSQFSSLIARAGGDVEALLRHLRARIAESR